MPVLNAHLDLLLQIVTVVCLVPMVFMVFTVVVCVSFVTRSLHLEGLSKDSSTLREGIDFL